MHELCREKYQTPLRAIVLLGVLVGLLFSCGEGIRLLPFPSAEISFGSISGWMDESRISYQKNAPRLENKKENHSKHKRENSTSHLTGGCDFSGSFNNSLTSTLAISSKKFFSFRRSSVQSILIAQSGGSRPPPLSSVS